MTGPSLFNALLFVLLGFLLFTALLTILLRMLPGNVWARAVEQNQLGPAIIIASLALALGLIIASAVH